MVENDIKNNEILKISKNEDRNRKSIILKAAGI